MRSSTLSSMHLTFLTSGTSLLGTEVRGFVGGLGSRGDFGVDKAVSPGIG